MAYKNLQETESHTFYNLIIILWPLLLTFSRKILITHFFINCYHDFYTITSPGSPPGFGLLNNDLSLSSSGIAPLARI